MRACPVTYYYVIKLLMLGSALKGLYLLGMPHADGFRTRLIAWGWLKAADNQASGGSPKLTLALNLDRAPCAPGSPCLCCLWYAGSGAQPFSAPLAPDVYGAISQYLPDAASRASLFATCTAARDGVLSSCQSLQITLVGSTKGLQQRAALLARARSNGLVKEQASNSMTLRLKARTLHEVRAVASLHAALAHARTSCACAAVVQGIHSWSLKASQQVVAALPGVRTLVLRDCIMPASQLAPLLSGGPIMCVRLEGNSDLSDGVSAPGQGLLDLLSLSPSLTSLELTGVTQHFRPPAPAAEAQEGGSTTPQLPALSPSLKRLSLQQSGNLSTWAHVFKHLPALQCVEVTTAAAAVEDISCLPQVAPSFMCLRTLSLPDAFISQGQDGSVLRALLQLPMLEHVQVGVIRAWVVRFLSNNR
jgi:hypothetical protein